MRESKRCPHCREIKPGSAFIPNASRPGGVSSWCRSCAGARAKLAYANNREYWRKYHREWAKRKREASPDLVRTAYLQRRWGMTEDQFAQMLADQDGLCALCGQVLKNERGPGRMAIDHDHSTGVIRGLLHAKCNVALGVVEDVGAAPFAAYLRRHRVRIA